MLEIYSKYLQLKILFPCDEISLMLIFCNLCQNFEIPYCWLVKFWNFIVCIINQKYSLSVVCLKNLTYLKTVCILRKWPKCTPQSTVSL